MPIFLSTLPARGATCPCLLRPAAPPAFLSTLPARGATGRQEERAGSKQFLSTLPARGATRRPRAAGPEQRISIHAPREGSDPKSGSQGSRSRNFYPRSPRGERQYTTTAGDRQAAFLSTLPARGATLDRQREAAEKGISIHAPREGSDRQRAKAERQSRNFYPRSPRGERRAGIRWRGWMKEFLSTLPARGATGHSFPGKAPVFYFYPRSPRGERPLLLLFHHLEHRFLSTLPARGATAAGRD